MALAVACLAAQGPCALEDPACVAASYPRFYADLQSLGARVGTQLEAEA
jgi:5-enolpyruvylshikimate-3-phosphate synthase